MRTKTKVWLIIAASLVLTGLIIFGGVMLMLNWDFTKLSTVKYETNTYEVGGAFDKIVINEDTADIVFLPSDNENCKVVCNELQNMKHSVSLKNETLFINRSDKRKWYNHIGIFFGKEEMTVYLPKESYASLFINTDTGDIDIPKVFAFKELKIDGDTSSVSCSAFISELMEIELSTGSIKADSNNAKIIDLSTNTGSISISSIESVGKINIKTDTGTVKLTDIKCADLTAESSTGDIRLKNTLCSGNLNIESDTGDVRFEKSDSATIYVKTSTGDVSFENSDSATIYVKTSTGDVEGSLLTDKIFITKTHTGNISVPNTVTGGRCEITTDTGDIKLSVI